MKKSKSKREHPYDRGYWHADRLVKKGYRLADLKDKSATINSPAVKAGYLCRIQEAYEELD